MGRSNLYSSIIPKGSVDFTMDGQMFGQLAELPDGNMALRIIAWLDLGEEIYSVPVVPHTMKSQRRLTYTATQQMSGLKLQI